MAWEEFRKKIKMKRTGNKPGNVASGGGVGNSILQSGEIIVQRLSAEVSGKAQKYTRIGAREFVEFKYPEVTLENIKSSCENHFKSQLGSDYYCDILAGDQGPSCSSLSHIPNLKVIHVRFVRVSKRKASSHNDVQTYEPLIHPPMKLKRGRASSNVSTCSTPQSFPTSRKALVLASVPGPSCYPKSLSVADMLKLGKNFSKAGGTVVHLFRFDLQQMLWSSVPTDIELYIEDSPIGVGGFREAFKATCSSPAFRNTWVLKKYHEGTLKIIADLGITIEQHTKRIVQMHTLARNFCYQLKAKICNEGVSEEYGEFLHYGEVYFGKLDDGECVTIEEFIPGNFVKYMNNTGIMCTTHSDDKDIGQKAENLAHFSYENSQQKLMVTDIQGSGYSLYDPEVASANLTDADQEVLFCAGNLSNYAIETFKANHVCRKFCKLTRLEEICSV